MNDKMILVYLMVHAVILFSGSLIFYKRIATAMFFTLSKDLGFILYFWNRFKAPKWKFRSVFYISGILLMYWCFFCFICDFQLLNIIGFHWKIPSLFQYTLFGLVGFFLLSRKIENDFTCLTYSFIICTIIGVLYELPLSFANYKIYVHYSYPFLLHPAWVLLGLLLFQREKPELKFYIRFFDNPDEVQILIQDFGNFLILFLGFLIFALTTVFQFLRFDIEFAYIDLLYRIPSFIFLITLVLGSKRFEK